MWFGCTLVRMLRGNVRGTCVVCVLWDGGVLGICVLGGYGVGGVQCVLYELCIVGCEWTVWDL
jgi:hypothetical protein